MRRRHPSIPGLQQIVIPHRLRGRLCTIAHHLKLTGQPGDTRTHIDFEKTNCWQQMNADVFSANQNCLHCVKNRVWLRKIAKPLKSFPMFEPPKTVTIDILGPLCKSRRDFQYIFVIVDRLTELFLVPWLRRIGLLDAAQAFLEEWVYKILAPKALLSDNEKQIKSRFSQKLCLQLETANKFTFTYYPQTNGHLYR